MEVLNIDKKALALTVVLVLAVAGVAGCTGNGETNDGTGNSTFDSGDLSGEETYSGDWSGSIGVSGFNKDFSGTWQFTVDFDEGTVQGSFDGDGSGDITGSVSDGAIDASGEAGFGAVEWSGGFTSGGEEVSGTWEISEEASGYGAGSGEWSGSLDESVSEEETEEGEETNGEQVDVNSVDVTMNKYEGGEIAETVNMKARNLDKETPDLRVELDSGKILLYNNKEGVGYNYVQSDDVWVEMSGSILEDSIQGYADMAVDAQETAMEYGAGGTADIQYGGAGAEIIVEEVNPTIPDDEFTPPEGAEVQ